MSDNPKPQITSNDASLQGSSLLGLTPETATLEDCSNAMKYVSEGHVNILPHPPGYALIGDGSLESHMMGGFFDISLNDVSLASLPPLERLARAINRFASALDAANPVDRKVGIPSRMQMLWTMQNNPNLARG